VVFLEWMWSGLFRVDVERSFKKVEVKPSKSSGKF